MKMKSKLKESQSHVYIYNSFVIYQDYKQSNKESNIINMTIIK